MQSYGNCKPTFHSFSANVGEKPFYTVEVYKSSTLAIRSTRDFAKNANANCGIWVTNHRRYGIVRVESVTPPLKGGVCIRTPPQLCIPFEACSFGLIVRYIRAY